VRANPRVPAIAIYAPASVPVVDNVSLVGGGPTRFHSRIFPGFVLPYVYTVLQFGVTSARMARRDFSRNNDTQSDDIGSGSRA